jgi:IS5 family transposase
MKAHIGLDADSGLVHTLIGTAANAPPMWTPAQRLLPGDEKQVYGDAGYQGVEEREERKTAAAWQVAMRPGTRIYLHA